MQVNIERQDVHTNVAKSNEFTVTKDSAKLFSLLSTVLYTNKELAVIHENCANAVDIHTQIGKADVPIRVVMPTRLAPNFVVRDFGTGLSESDVYRLLTTYGETTKSGENNSIGGWGIGFKSTAAVTDSWTIKSYFGGECSEYLIFVNSHGIPSITKIKSDPSDETGLEVIIPVSQNRFHVWEDSVRKAFKHYPTKPELVNFHHVWDEQKFILEEDRFVIRSTQSNRISVVTSNREYIVDVDKLVEEFKSRNMQHLIGLLHSPISLKVKIGELDLSLSRESIQYTRKTVDAMVTILSDIYDNLYNKADTILSTSTDALDIRKNIQKVQEQVFGSRNVDWPNKLIVDVLNKKYSKYNIRDLKRDINYFTVEFKYNIESYKMVAFNGRSRRTINRKFNCWKTQKVVARQDYQNDLDYLQFNISAIDSIRIVVNDCHGAMSRAQYSHKPGSIDIVCVIDSFPEEFTPYVVKASSLPKPPRKVGAVLSVGDLYTVSGGRWVKTDETPSANSAYIVIEDARKVSIKRDSLEGILDQYNIDLYAVKKGTAPPTGMKTAKEKAEELVALHNTQKNADVKWAKSFLYYSGGSYHACRNVVASIVKKYSGSNPDFVEIQNAMKVALTMKDVNYTDVSDLCNCLNIQQLTSKNKSFDEMSETVYNKYEMLKYFDDYKCYEPAAIEACIKYVDDVYSKGEVK